MLAIPRKTKQTFSVIMESTHPSPVNGNVHSSSILCFPPYTVTVAFYKTIRIACLHVDFSFEEVANFRMKLRRH
jgi:hypothetical protein